VSLEAGGGIPRRPNPAATLLVIVVVGGRAVEGTK